MNQDHKRKLSLESEIEIPATKTRRVDILPETYTASSSNIVTTFGNARVKRPSRYYCLRCRIKPGRHSEMSRGHNYICSLPNELMIRIFRYCNDDLYALSRVSRRFQNIIYSHMSYIFRRKVKRLVIECNMQQPTSCNYRTVFYYKRPPLRMQQMSRKIAYGDRASALTDILRKAPVCGSMEFRVVRISAEMLAPFLADHANLREVREVCFTFCDFGDVNVTDMRQLFSKMSDSKLSVTFDYCRKLCNVFNDSTFINVPNLKALIVRCQDYIRHPTLSLGDNMLQLWSAQHSLRMLDLDESYPTHFTLDGVLHFLHKMNKTRSSDTYDLNLGCVRVTSADLMQHIDDTFFAADGRYGVQLKTSLLSDNSEEQKTDVAVKLLKLAFFTDRKDALLDDAQLYLIPEETTQCSPDSETVPSEVGQMFNYYFPQLHQIEKNGFNARFFISLQD